MGAVAAFDRIAPVYDEIWTNSTAGRLQRDAVWRATEPLFYAGDRLLDLGCGTGEDALHFETRGARVFGIDASPAMVEVARGRGVNAHILPIEAIGELPGIFDGALSNFGALNCVESLDRLRPPLAKLIRPGGYLVICLIGKFCAWETLWYSRRGEFSKAFRRIGRPVRSSLGMQVFYSTVRQVRTAFAPDFSLVQVTGVGIMVPPSYVRGIGGQTLERLGRIDRRISAWRLASTIADHRLLIFQRSWQRNQP